MPQQKLPRWRRAWRDTRSLENWRWRLVEFSALLAATYWTLRRWWSPESAVESVAQGVVATVVTLCLVPVLEYSMRYAQVPRREAEERVARLEGELAELRQQVTSRAQSVLPVSPEYRRSKLLRWIADEWRSSHSPVMWLSDAVKDGDWRDYVATVEQFGSTGLVEIRHREPRPPDGTGNIQLKANPEVRPDSS